MRMHSVRRLAVISRAAFGLSLAELTCAGRPHAGAAAQRMIM